MSPATKVCELPKVIVTVAEPLVVVKQLVNVVPVGLTKG